MRKDMHPVSVRAGQANFAAATAGKPIAKPEAGMQTIAQTADDVSSPSHPSQSGIPPSPDIDIWGAMVIAAARMPSVATPIRSVTMNSDAAMRNTLSMTQTRFASPV
jgi:hypothetical protein